MPPFSATGDSGQQIEFVAIFKVYFLQQLYVCAVEQDITVIPNGLLFTNFHGLNLFLEYRAEFSLHIISDVVNTVHIDGDSSCAEKNPPRSDEVDINCRQIRYPLIMAPREPLLFPLSSMLQLFRPNGCGDFRHT